MAKKKKEIEIVPKEQRSTIKNFFSSVLENKECLVFFVIFDGAINASSQKHKFARATIAIPPEICRENLKGLDDWAFYGVAIPKTLLKKIQKQKEEVK